MSIHACNDLCDDIEGYHELVKHTLEMVLAPSPEEVVFELDDLLNHMVIIRAEILEHMEKEVVTGS